VDRSQRVRTRRQRTRSEISTHGSRRRISAVGFDFDHTLGIDNKLERVAFLRLLDRACRDEGASCIGTLADEIERIDALLARQRSGACTIEQAVEQFVQERGVRSPDGYTDEYKRMCVDMVDEFVIPEPGAAHMLAELRRRGIPCAILTNGWTPLQRRKAQRVGFEGPVVVSGDLGVQKPEPKAFDALCAALGAPAAEIAFVGDTPESDVIGALDAGMFSVWFDAEGVKYPQDAPAPSAVIHTLAELLSLV
jgi:HAD superfamily hydrolase (TIGR01549 family)